MGKMGEAFKAAQPDLIIVISNDHADQFILRSVPPFMIHCGMQAQGKDEHKGGWAVDGEAGYTLLERMQEEGFDPAFTLDADLGTYFTIPVEFFGYSRETPVLPLFVNSYVPPQPMPERCYAFGQALARAVERMGRRALIVASGGLSHYPGTARYADPGPDNDGDQKIIEHCRAGNLRYLLSLDANELDRTGNIELRSWLILAGAVGERRPDMTAYEPNWHHNYGIFAWLSMPPVPTGELYYGATPSSRVELSRALYALRTDREACRRYIADAAGFAAEFRLSDNERAALIALDEVGLRDGLRVHPLLSSGAARHLNAVRKSEKA
jgi:2,3-dihydroxyphenylpropionate 1,2-dioxygenase